jgi:hypothetical protein
MRDYSFVPQPDYITEESPLLDDSHLRAGNSRSTNSETVIPRKFASPTLSEIAKYGGYSTYNAQSNTDPYVRLTLKTYSRDVYDSIYGYTRRPQGTIGMYNSLLRFSGKKNEFNDLNRSQKRCMIAAIQSAKKAFKLPWKREPLDWHEVGKYMRRDTAAGVTFMGQKKGDCMEEIYHEARWLGHRMKQDGRGPFNPSKVRFPPCVAGQRGAMSEIGLPKTRLVWIYPAEMLVIEGFYAPRMYHDFMAQSQSPMLNGKSAQRLYTEWTCHLKEGETLYGIDFSSFDSTVPAWLIRTAFNILRQNIDWDHFNGEKVSKKDRQKWKNVWDGMVWYFINTPILMPDGRMFRKSRGVPSGTWFTQMIDSVVNYIVIQYLANCQQSEIRNLKVLGDDSAFRSGADFSLEQGQVDCDPLGMIMKPEKCEKTEDPSEFKLLGTVYKNQHAHRPTEEWFKLALYPESAVQTVDVSLTRLIGLWLGGAMFDRDFCAYMEYFQSSYQCPEEGWFSKDQRRWLEVVYSGKSPRGWTTKKSLFWRSIFYAYG